VSGKILLRIEEASERLALPEEDVQKLIDSGELTTTPICGTALIDADSLKQFTRKLKRGGRHAP
jgi:excisionase family DNA binding protein